MSQDDLHDQDLIRKVDALLGKHRGSGNAQATNLEAAAEALESPADVMDIVAKLAADYGGFVVTSDLGQTQGQRILGELSTSIPGCAVRGLGLEDDELGFSEPGLAIASALHERQYSRLFRS